MCVKPVAVAITDYETAIRWLGCEYVKCDKIADIDASVWENIRWDAYNEDSESCDDICEWYLTNATLDSVKKMEDIFGLTFSYSDLLECFILCVCHTGTDWRYVGCDVFDKDAADTLDILGKLKRRI